MKLTLINPPSHYLENDAAYPPSGLLYIAGKAEELGHSAEIIDLTGRSDWVSGLSHVEQSDLFGITCVTPNVPTVLRIMDMLPEETPVMIGGPHPTALPYDTITRAQRDHTIVLGEAETILEQILKDVEKDSIKQFYYGGDAPVESIPMPARHLVNLHRYKPGGQAATPVYLSRGCPYRCRFCSNMSRKMRIFSLDRIKRELEEVRELGFKTVVFGDDNCIIALNKLGVDNVLEIFKDVGISFRINQDARHYSRELFEKYVEAGCTDISFGIESGSQDILNAMNKQITVEQNAEAINLAQVAGLRVRAYFVVNFPGETQQSVDETIRFIEEHTPDSALLSSFAPLPGSYVFDHPWEYGITYMSPDWSDYFLVGKGGEFKPCYATEDLSFEQQINYHRQIKEVIS